MKTVLLDLGGVVFNSTNKKNLIDWNIISNLNLKYQDKLDKGNISFQYFLNDYNLISNQNLTLNQFFKYVFDTVSFNVELIDYLKQKFEIVILSDNYEENVTYFSKKYQLSNWSKNQFYSYQYGLKKSNPDFFLKVLQLLETHPNNCVFIDDDQENVVIAEQIGINSILFKNNNQAFKQIERLVDN